MSKTRRNFIKNAGTVGAVLALGTLDVASASAKKGSSEARSTRPEIHCIVTGRNKAGKSVIVSKDAVNAVSAALAPGYEFFRLWGSDAVPALPSDGTPPAQAQYFPPKNGFRFGMFTLPPTTAAAIAPAITPANIAEFNQKLPGMGEVLEQDHPGMHTTDTVDFDVVVFGEVWNWTMAPRCCSKLVIASSRMGLATPGIIGLRR
jgi:hypothetical protein